MVSPLQLQLGVEPVTLDDANDQLRDALAIRIDAHWRRCDNGSDDGRAGGISVPEYLQVLAWVRQVEDELEPIREAAGYTCSCAYELCSARTLAESGPPPDFGTASPCGSGGLKPAHRGRAFPRRSSDEVPYSRSLCELSDQDGSRRA